MKFKNLPFPSEPPPESTSIVKPVNTQNQDAIVSRATAMQMS